jgi:hypothetical protein
MVSYLFFNLFICGIFNGVGSSSEHKVSNGKMVTELEGMWKGSGHSLI